MLNHPASPTDSDSKGYRWVPTPEQVARTNVGRFMVKHGIETYAQLVRQSSDDPEWFWHGIVLALGLEWTKSYKRVMDDSEGIAWTKWFVGGLLNVTRNCVDRHAESSRKEKTALIWEGEDRASRTLTYGELDAEVSRLANLLKRLGVAPGDRVAIYLPMCPEGVAGFLASAKIGAVAVPIFSGFGAKALADRLLDSGASVLLTLDGFPRKGKRLRLKDVVDEALMLCPAVKSVVVHNRLGLDVSLHPTRDLDWAEAVAGESSECPALPVPSEHPLFIGYTSGTTGKPKGAVHVHGGFLVKIAQEVAHQIDLREDDVLYWLTDLGWIMGPWEVVGALTFGATVVLYEGAPDHPAPDRIWSLVETHRVTILGTSPTLIRSLMRHGEAPVRSHDLSSLRILASTGEPWSPDAWIWYFENVGGGRCPLVNFSGGTEVGACLLSASPATALKPCSLGSPALGMAVEVFDPEGKPIVGGVGELVCVKPWPGMTRGLWNDPERYLQTYWSRWPDVWTHGDWASIDADGEWFLHGRSDDTLKVSGKRIGPAEVEAALVAHPLISEAAAVGLPHEIKGEGIWAFVVLQGETPPAALATLEAELIDRVAAALGRSFAPEHVIVIPELPKTRSGKIVRRVLRAKALGDDPGDLSSLENPTSLDDILACIQG